MTYTRKEIDHARQLAAAGRLRQARVIAERYADAPNANVRAAGNAVLDTVKRKRRQRMQTGCALLLIALVVFGVLAALWWTNTMAAVDDVLATLTVEAR